MFTLKDELFEGGMVTKSSGMRGQAVRCVWCRGEEGTEMERRGS